MEEIIEVNFRNPKQKYIVPVRFEIESFVISNGNCKINENFLKKPDKCSFFSKWFKF